VTAFVSEVIRHVATALSLPLVSSPSPTDAAVPNPEDSNLILDELSQHLRALRVLRVDNPDQAAVLLESLGASGKVEEDIVLQLGAIKPLWIPDRFEEANRLAMRSLEVLDRNGPRNTALKTLGPMRPVGEWAVQLFTQLIVRSFQQTVVDRLRHLYSRREASSAWDSPEHHMLRRARIDIERIAPGLKGRALGLPTFLLGGAFISTILGGLKSLGEAIQNNNKILIVATVVMFIVFAGASWAILQAAAISRRRIKLTLDKPLAALFETIGACGNPPKDQSLSFALYAIVLTGLGWLILPLGVAYLFLK
jgi:hypothetical protein